MYSIESATDAELTGDLSGSEIEAEVEAEVEDQPTITTPQILGIEAIGRNVVKLPSNRYVTFQKIQGLDMKLRSRAEKQRSISGLAKLFHSFNSDFAFYAHSRPRDTGPIIEHYNQQRQAEQNPHIRRENYNERDFVQNELSQANALMDREYWFCRQASPGDVKANEQLNQAMSAAITPSTSTSSSLSSTATTANEVNRDSKRERNRGGDGDNEEVGLLDTLKQRWKMAWGGNNSEESASLRIKDKSRLGAGNSMQGSMSGQRQGGAGDDAIPIRLAEILNRTNRSTAERFKAIGMPGTPLLTEGIIDMLADYLESPSFNLGMNPESDAVSGFSRSTTTNTNPSSSNSVSTTTGTASPASSYVASNTSTSTAFSTDAASDRDRSRELGYRSKNRSRVNPLYRIGGATIEEHPKYLRLNGDTYVGCLWVTDLPTTARPDELFELVSLTGIDLMLATHARPLTVKKASRDLKRKEQSLWARGLNQRSRAGDMGQETQLEQTREMRRSVARGDIKLFRLGIRLAVKAGSRQQLEADLQRVALRLQELNYEVAFAHRNQLRAFLSTIPTGMDWLGAERFIKDRTLHPNVTGEHVALFLPNSIIDLAMQGGIIIGTTKIDAGLVTFNRWIQLNGHTIAIATSGAGKTNAMLEECAREMINDHRLECFYIDPQGVVGRFARLIGGTVIDMGETGHAIINPMDRFIKNGLPETVGQRLKFLYPLLELMLKGDLSASQRAAIHRAAKRYYRHFEDGESMLKVLENSFAAQPLYAPLRPFLYDQRDPQTGQVVVEGIMTRLGRIYAELREKYRVPTTGLVRGREAGNSNMSNPPHPICELDPNTNRWYYKGAGETTERNALADEFAREAQAALQSRTRIADKKVLYPAQVLHTDPAWFDALGEEFTNRVEDEGIFAALDYTAASQAIRDALVELKSGQGVLSDFLPFLAAEDADELVMNLEQFVDQEDGYGSMFNGWTNIRLDKRFVCFDVSSFEESDELIRAIRMFQIINITWGITQAIRLPRLVIVDELGLLIQFADIARYIKNLFMRGRAYYLSMTGLVQNITSILDYQAARQCVENANRIILMRQEQDAIERLQAHYKLTDGQVGALLMAEPGDCLMKINGRWVWVHYSISPHHLRAFDTRPAEAVNTEMVRPYHRQARRKVG